MDPSTAPSTFSPHPLCLTPGVPSRPLCLTPGVPPPPIARRNAAGGIMDLARQAQNRRIANRPACELNSRKNVTGNVLNLAIRAYRRKYAARAIDDFKSETESESESESEDVTGPAPMPMPDLAVICRAIHRDYSYDCLVGNIPNTSASQGALPSATLPDNMFTYNTRWQPAYDPFHTLQRTAYEFREHMLTPMERRVALPWEIKRANVCTITHRVLRDVWLERYNEQFAEEAARCKSAVVEETLSDADETTVAERRVQSQPVAEWEVIRARMKQAADNMRRLAKGKPDPVMDRLANGPHEQPQEQPKPEPLPLAQPLKIVGRTPPPRPHMTTALGFAESGLEQYLDCGCGPLTIKCPRCNAAAVCDAMEDVF